MTGLLFPSQAVEGTDETRLILQLETGTCEEKVTAAQSLASLGQGVDAVTYRLQAALGDRDSRVRPAAASALGDIGQRDFSAIASLSRLVEDDDALPVRFWAGIVPDARK